jgi:2-haloacid dehalogenase
MTTTLAFDVYGTLIDTSGVIEKLKDHVPGRSAAFSAMWREKQLEYSFRRELMQNYRDFSVCTRQALDYTCRVLAVDLAEADRDDLMQVYRVLPSFPEVTGALETLRARDARLFAFSNGTADAVRGLLRNAGIDGFFDDVVSTDEIRSFKPNPGVYAHFLRRSGATGAEAWLISSNPFDVIGAISAGMRAAWVRRSSQAVFDPWEIQPTVTIGGLAELPDSLGLGSAA